MKHVASSFPRGRLRPALTSRLLLTFLAAAPCSTSPGADKKPGNDPWSTVWVNQPPQPLPDGVSHRTYPSAAMGHDVGYCIYLPPQYDQDPARRFPVIYYLHGGGGDERTALPEAEFLHRQITSGALQPFILVAPNGGRGSYFADSADGKVMSETTIIHELIPHVDATYRTIAERRGRCLQGFSMGALGATKFACKYPEIFCSLAAYAGGMKRLGERFRAGKVAEGGGYSKKYLGDDPANWDANDSFALVHKNADRIRGRLAIKLMCGTADPDHLAATMDFHRELTGLGIEHTYAEIADMGHTPGAMREACAESWFNPHVAAIRAAGGAE